jgi:hypothetical protein
MGLILRQRSSGVEPALLCGGCGQLLAIQRAWLVWRLDTPEDEPRWLHRHCVRGRARRVIMWKASDVLSFLLRQTEESEICGSIPVRGLKSGKPS